MTYLKRNLRLSIGAFVLIVVAVAVTSCQRVAEAPHQADVKKRAPREIPGLAIAATKPDAEVKRATATAQQQSTPAPIVAAGEPIIDVIPGAVSIPMLNGPELTIVPADPNKPRAQQLEWRYIPVFRIDKVKYDAEEKILTAMIDARMSEQTRARVFDMLRKITGAPAPNGFQLNPGRVQSLAVQLQLFGTLYTLDRTADTTTHEILNGPIPLDAFKVTDEALHRWLSKNLHSTKIAIRTTHPYAALTRHTIHVESSLTAARQSFESVVPKGILDDLEAHPLIVDRDSMLQLQQALREEFRVRVEGNPVQFAGLDRVLDKMLDRIPPSTIPLHEVTGEMIDAALVWDSKAAKLEVAPNQRKTMTHALEESKEDKKMFKFIWDKAQETLRNSNDAEAWHNTLHDEFKLNAKLSIGVKMFSGSAEMNLEKSFKESTEGSKKASREAFDKIKNTGEKWEESFSRSYRNFRGEDWATKVEAKILNLQRVTNLNVVAFRSALLEHVDRTRVGMLERVTYLALEPSSDSPVSDALREIQLLQDRLRIVEKTLNDPPGK